ncbi:hypothetical protein GF373_07470, partial [bacterium]|nr:hypothetical protein [bacterium]
MGFKYKKSCLFAFWGPPKKSICVNSCIDGAANVVLPRMRGKGVCLQESIRYNRQEILKKAWEMMNKPKGVLIDLDGVMYVEDRLVPGAVEAIAYLRDAGIPYRFLTNTTIKSKQTLFEQLQDMGIPAEKGQIISPPGEAANFLREQGCP